MSEPQTPRADESHSEARTPDSPNMGNQNAPEARDNSSTNNASNAASADAAAGHAFARPATFQLLYESRDGRMCLFQDEAGHLTCVRSDRFA